MAAKIPESPARSAYLALVQAHEALSEDFRLLFQTVGLSPSQFNVLRILLTGPEEGVSCGHIGRELIHRVPDVTRLVDRMETAGLVERERNPADRRVVLVRATARGREACESLYPALDRIHRLQFTALSTEEQQQLDRLLRRVLATAQR